MLNIPYITNTPQDVAQLENFINQFYTQYMNNFGPGLLAQNIGTVNSSTGGSVTAASFALLPQWMNGAVRAVRLRVYGITANNVNTKTVNVVLGGGSITFTQALTTSTAAAWEVEAIIQAAGTNLQRALCKITHGLAAPLLLSSSVAGTETSTAPIPLNFTLNTATANSDVVVQGSFLELLQ